MDIFGILTLVGGLALFLYGMSVMGGGLEKISGGRLELLLERLTSNSLFAVLLGAGVTAVIQSSSATTVMVVGFVNSGIMKLSQAIGIIMGANVGTTVTSWILSLTGVQGDNVFVRLLKPSSFSPVLALIGIILYMSGKNSKKKDVGEILLGFAVLMFGMESMSGAVKPLADVPEFTSMLTVFKNPLLGVVTGAVLTAVIQSSSASVGILQALSSTGAFTYASCIPIIMGQNIGTCVTAMLSAIGANKSARRTAFVHLYFNLIGAAVFMLFYFGLDMFIDFGFSNETVGAAGIALIHSVFNIATTILLLPFIHGLEKLAYLTIPPSEDEKASEEDMQFKILDDRFLQTPGFAIEQCRSLAIQMASLAQECFLKAVRVVFHNDSKETVEEVIALENRIDVYEDKIGVYLTKLSSQNLAYQDSQNVSTLLHCITDIERISDHAVNIVESAREMHKRKMHFSKKAMEEITIYTNAVEDILERALGAFIVGDEEQAFTVEPLEEVIDVLNKNVKKRHVKRLRKGKCTIELGLILSDIATNYERVADHCSNIALYLIQEQDTELEAHNYVNRLREKDGMSFEHWREIFEEKYHLGKNRSADDKVL